VIAIIDYGVGNIFSLGASLKYIGADAIVTSDPELISGAEKIILPGVGAFGDAAEALRKKGLDKIIVREAENGKPLLGICLGMQLLFKESSEFGTHLGLGLIDGKIQNLDARGYKIPHMGWNSLTINFKTPILENTRNGDYVYYVHSFYAPEGDYTAASSDYGVAVTGVAASKNVVGTQFHPEKSAGAGLKILRAFCEASE
jgi:glutamine amidotransferase